MNNPVLLRNARIHSSCFLRSSLPEFRCGGMLSARGESLSSPLAVLA